MQLWMYFQCVMAAKTAYGDSQVTGNKTHVTHTFCLFCYKMFCWVSVLLSPHAYRLSGLPYARFLVFDVGRPQTNGSMLNCLLWACPLCP